MKLERLHTTATLLAHDRGLHDTSMALIAKRAQMAVGTIYLYYPSKDHLFGELLARYYSYLNSQIQDPSPDTDFEAHLTAQFNLLKTAVLGDTTAFGLFLQLRQLKSFANRAKAEQDLFEQKLAKLMEPGRKQVMLKNLSTRCLGILFFEQICAQARYELDHPADPLLESKGLLEELCINSLFK